MEGGALHAGIWQGADHVLVVTVGDSILLREPAQAVTAALLVDVLLPGLAAQYLASGGDLKTLGGSLLGLELILGTNDDRRAGDGDTGNAGGGEGGGDGADRGQGLRKGGQARRMRVRGGTVADT
jgi:hypothetical protein